VGFRREWEFHRCKNLRFLTTLSRIRTGRHAKGSFRKHSRAGNRLCLLPVQYVPSLRRRHPVTIATAFTFSGGIETCPDAGLPPGVESFFDLEDCDLDSDFDCPAEDIDDPVEPQAEVPPDISERPQRSIKAYLVKYTAYRTLGGELHQVHRITNGEDADCARLSGIFTRETLPSPAILQRLSAPPPSLSIGLQMRFAFNKNTAPTSPSKNAIAQDGSSQNTGI